MRCCPKSVQHGLRQAATLLFVGLAGACGSSGTPADEPTETFNTWGRVQTFRWGEIPPATPLETLEATLATWPQSDAAPADWDVHEIAAAAVPGGQTLEEAYADDEPRLLAWRVVRDRRPLLIKACIVILRCRAADGSARFVLGSMYRHPDYEDRWFVSTVDDAPFVGRREFTTQPTRSDVLKFLNDCRWLFDSRGASFSSDEGWETLDAGLSPAAWEASLR